MWSSCIPVWQEGGWFLLLVINGSMSENTAMVSPGTNMASVEEALCAQQQLLQQVYNELDEEREASATAASEAVSMILRLQGEKASLKMEASQYKRMAEEKICLAEEALAVFEDLIYQRELQIASLEFQVQAYRCRLLSMGCSDLGVYENKFPDNLLMRRNDAVFGERGVNGNVRRLGSVPQVLTKDPNKKDTIERRRYATPTLDASANNEDESTIHEIKESEKISGTSSVEEINLYWEQIKGMDERVKEISDSRESVRNKSAIWRGSSWSPSQISQVSVGSSFDPTKALDIADLDQVGHHQSSPEIEAVADPSCSTDVQDIFEVPQVAKSSRICGPEEKQCPKLTVEGQKRLLKPDSISADIVKLSHKDDTKRIRKPLHSAIHELKVPKLRQDISSNRIVSPVHKEFSAVDSQVEYQHLVQRIERLEGERTNASREIVSKGKAELNLLKEIHEQIKSIESKMSKWRVKKSHLSEDPPLDPLQEAMVYFWL